MSSSAMFGALITDLSAPTSVNAINLQLLQPTNLQIGSSASSPISVGQRAAQIYLPPGRYLCESYANIVFGVTGIGTSTVQTIVTIDSLTVANDTSGIGDSAGTFSLSDNRQVTTQATFATGSTGSILVFGVANTFGGLGAAPTWQGVLNNFAGGLLGAMVRVTAL
jgi:hypothetical protein